jgi:hypothetical protein
MTRTEHKRHGFRQSAPVRPPEVAKHFKKGELEKLRSLDFHFKEVNNRFKEFGL